MTVLSNYCSITFLMCLAMNVSGCDNGFHRVRIADEVYLVPSTHYSTSLRGFTPATDALRFYINPQDHLKDRISVLIEPLGDRCDDNHRRGELLEFMCYSENVQIKDLRRGDGPYDFSLRYYISISGNDVAVASCTPGPENGMCLFMFRRNGLIQFIRVDENQVDSIQYFREVANELLDQWKIQ